jgi:hypothetical protein
MAVTRSNGGAGKLVEADAGDRSGADIPCMELELMPLFSKLEKAAVHGPGRHELVLIFFALPEKPYHLIDNYGRVWIRPKDWEKVLAMVIPPVAAAAPSF